MAFEVEVGLGSPTANSLGSVAAFRSYHTDRGFVTVPTYSDAQVQIALIAATEYIEAAWAPGFKGCPVVVSQALSWPRYPVYDARGLRYYDNDEIPLRLQYATFEYARITLTTGLPLMTTPTVDPTGQMLTEIFEKAAAVEERRKFSVGTAASFPSYPAADYLMREFVYDAGGGHVYR